MQWTARPDLTLEAVNPTDDERTAAAAVVRAFQNADEGAAPAAARLLDDLDAGVIQSPTLVHLGEWCHDGPYPEHAREPARAASRALFGFVLPTPEVGREIDFFWRVAGRL